MGPATERVKTVSLGPPLWAKVTWILQLNLTGLPNLTGYYRLVQGFGQFGV